jgi:Bacteriophage HK97-gp10, putative tail-component
VSVLVLNYGAINVALHSAAGPVARDLSLRAQRVQSQAVVNASGRPGPNVRTGRLRSSLHWRLVTGGLDGIYALVGTTVYYARYVEFGTDRSSPYPFLRPAARAAYGSHHAVL